MPEVKDPQIQPAVPEGSPDQPAPQAAPAAPQPVPAKPPQKKKAGRKKMVKRMIALSVVLALVAGIGFGMWYLVFRDDETIGQPLTAEAQIGTIQSTVEGNGNAVPKESAAITLNADGTVQEVYVTTGDQVWAGDPLYQIDSQEAREKLENLTAQMNDLLEEANNLTVTAPFSGKLIDVQEFQPDQEVSVGTKIATLVNDRKLKLSLYFSYAYEDQVRVGQTAQVSVPAVMYTGEGTVEQVNKVSFITPEGGVYFEAVIAFQNPGTLTAEMEASASLTDGDGMPIFPYEQSKTEYYESRKLATKAGGPLVSSRLLNHARVAAGEALLTMGSESLDEQLTAAQERLSEAQAAVDALNATAPIDGTVISCTIAEGGEVKAGDAVVTIQNTTVMTVTIQVDDRNIGFIKLGDMISLSDYNGNSYMGTVSNIAMQGEAGQGMSTFPVTLEVDNFDGSLYAGVWLNYSVVTSQSSDCVLVPTTAVKSVLDAEGNKQAVVFVQREERPAEAIDLDASITGVPGEADKYWPVPVTTGISDAKQVEIISGVEAGDMVFINYTVDPGNGMGGGIMFG